MKQVIQMWEYKDVFPVWYVNEFAAHTFSYDRNIFVGLTGAAFDCWILFCIKSYSLIVALHIFCDGRNVF